MKNKKCVVCSKQFARSKKAGFKQWKASRFCSRSCVATFTNETHGMDGTRFLRTFRSLKDRCNNPNNTKFKYYGGRGIECEWGSPEEFITDMHESYEAHVKKFGEKETTINRITNDGNYCKDNCRWSTNTEQNRNKRNNQLLTFQGKTSCMAEWAENLNISYSALYSRINIRKWSIERALTEESFVGKNQTFNSKRLVSLVD